MGKLKNAMVDVDSQEEDFSPRCEYRPTPEEELESYLAGCLSGLRGHISESTFALVEKELGFEPMPPSVPYVWKDDGEPLPF